MNRLRITTFNSCLGHFIPLIFIFHTSVCFYVGPEVGQAPGESRVRQTRFFFPFPAVTNATSLAEAAYVPYVYAVGNNVNTFLRSIIPALQPKVDFFAEQIQDGIDLANGKLMQTLENSNNGIIAVENFFTGLMKAFVFGKGPDDDEEERKRRLAMAISLAQSEMKSLTTTSTTTESPIATSSSTTGQPKTTKVTMTTSKIMINLTNITSTTGRPKTTKVTMTSKIMINSANITSTTVTPPTTTGASMSTMAAETVPTTNTTLKPKGEKSRDNNFNKMKVIKIVNNML